MLNFLETFIYSFLFLLNKYLSFHFIENLLHRYENTIIKKYVNKKPVIPMKIPTIDGKDLTNRAFIKLSNNYKNPVLIKGFLKDSPAVEQWDIDYLKNIIGDFKINTLNKEPKLEIKSCTFNHFANVVEEGNIYINNNHTILSHFPLLYNDIKSKFKLLINTLYSTNLRNIHIANLFIWYNNGDKVNGSNMHCGGSGNFFCMIKGRKRWTLINPKYSSLLKGRVAKSGIHGQTLFDMPDIPLSEYPKIFTYLPRYDVTLEPGDILWNAPWWWHRIENDAGLSIGLAIRNNKVTKINLLNNFTYTLSGYTYLVYNTLIIGLYERLFLKKKEHFGHSKKEDDDSNVLYQIKKLIEKYPNSLDIDDIN